MISNLDHRSVYIVYTLILFIMLFNLMFIISSFGLGNLVDIYFGDSGTNGNSVKLQLSEAISGGKLGWITDLSTALLVWLFWKTMELDSRTVRRLLLVSIFIYFINSIISVSRDSIVSLSIMLFSIYVHFQYKKGVLSLKKIISLATLFIGIFILVFSAIGLARSSNFISGTQEIIKQLFGYFPASYNRLAYILNGDLVYPNSGWGYYSTQFIWDIPLISGSLGIYDFGRQLGIPLPISAYENWQNQFLAVQMNGLDPSFIWATAYGFAFSDFGYFSAIYFILYGFISGIVYKSFISYGNFGIILYPYIISSIIKWSSVQAFPQRGILIFLSAYIIIYLVEQICKVRKNEATKNIVGF